VLKQLKNPNSKKYLELINGGLECSMRKDSVLRLLYIIRECKENKYFTSFSLFEKKPGSGLSVREL